MFITLHWSITVNVPLVGVFSLLMVVFINTHTNFTTSKPQCKPITTGLNVLELDFELIMGG